MQERANEVTSLASKVSSKVQGGSRGPWTRTPLDVEETMRRVFCHSRLGCCAWMKTGKRLSVLQRQEIGLSVHKRPCKASLARRYKCTRSVVDRWLEEGLKKDPDYSDMGGRGRKTKYSSEQASCIKRWAKSGLSTISIASKTPHRHHVHVSKSTAHRILRGGKHPLEYCVVRRSATLRAKNKHARVQFCQDKPRPHVSTWVFVDASTCMCTTMAREGVNRRGKTSMPRLSLKGPTLGCSGFMGQ